MIHLFRMKKQNGKKTSNPFFKTHFVGVAELDSPEDLEDESPRVGLREPLGVVLQLLEDGLLDVLEDEEELPALPEHLDQVDQVLVAQALHGGWKY